MTRMNTILAALLVLLHSPHALGEHIRGTRRLVGMTTMTTTTKSTMTTTAMSPMAAKSTGKMSMAMSAAGKSMMSAMNMTGKSAGKMSMMSKSALGGSSNTTTPAPVARASPEPTAAPVGGSSNTTTTAPVAGTSPEPTAAPVAGAAPTAATPTPIAGTAAPTAETSSGPTGKPSVAPVSTNAPIIGGGIGGGLNPPSSPSPETTAPTVATTAEPTTSGGTSESSSDTVVGIITNSSNHSILETAVASANLTRDLMGQGPFTVFAPTDAAFATLGQYTLDRLLMPQYRYHLIDLLLYHVVSGSYLSSNLMAGKLLTLNKKNVTVTLDPLMINDAIVTTPDLKASNGIVDVIDKVLLPLSATENAISLVLNEANFTILVDLIGAADLTDTLSGRGNFTVFAPTNAAFEALGNETLNSLLLPENAGTLLSILTYHVTDGIITSDMLMNGEKITMLDGENTTITFPNGTAMINNANIVEADNLVNNGIVHIIDAVLIPPRPGVVTVNVSMTFKIRGAIARQLTEPGTQELFDLALNITEFFSLALSQAFPETFYEYNPVNFLDEAAPSVGWTLSFVEDLLFSNLPNVNAILATMTSAANSTLFLQDYVITAGPYFAQTTGVDIMIEANVKNVTAVSSVVPSMAPTIKPTTAPVTSPPVQIPGPTATPIATPTPSPTLVPSTPPTSTMEFFPTLSPTALPTSSPTALPAGLPTGNPTDSPTGNPTDSPTAAPSQISGGSGESLGTVEPTLGPVRPQNDQCEQASPVSLGLPIFGSTKDALNDTASLECPDISLLAAGVWYSYEAIGSSVQVIFTSTFEAEIALFVGDSCDNLTCTSGHAVLPSTNTPTVLDTVDGQLYYLFVHSSNGKTGNFNLVLRSGVGSDTQGTPGPSGGLTSKPTVAPVTSAPSYMPSTVTSDFPSLSPTEFPSLNPSGSTLTPTGFALLSPSDFPTLSPVDSTASPPAFTSYSPNGVSSYSPTDIAVAGPSVQPSALPSDTPVADPSSLASELPSGSPSDLSVFFTR